MSDIKSKELPLCPFCGKMPESKKVSIPFDSGPKPKIAVCSCGAFLTINRWGNRPLEDALRTRIAELEMLYKLALGRIELGDKKIAEQDKKINAASNLLESISRYFYKKGYTPDPMWTDQYKEVCQIFEPDDTVSE